MNKKCFVTLVKNHNGRTEIFNGFSFIIHRIPGDHFFFYETDDIKYIKSKLDKYTTIYCTAICAGELIFIKKLIDSRWILGGPIFRLFSKDFIKLHFPNTVVIPSSFEDYLNIKKENIFTAYWNTWLKDKDINIVGYGANCGSNCYWGKCLFCRTTHKENDERDIKLIYQQLPEYNIPSVVHLRFGSIPSKDLQDLIECINNNPKRNSIFRIYVRGTEEIKQVVENAKDLSNILFLIGLESLSQTTLNSINKGTNLKTVLEIIKIIEKKGAYSEITLISRIPSPFIEQSLNESIDTVKWIKDNIPLNKKIFFYDSVIPEWPDERTAALFGKYEVKNLEFGEKYFFKEKLITSIIKKEDELLYSIPIQMLEEHGYKIEKRI